MILACTITSTINKLSHMLATSIVPVNLALNIPVSDWYMLCYKLPSWGKKSVQVKVSSQQRFWYIDSRSLISMCSFRSSLTIALLMHSSAKCCPCLPAVYVHLLFSNNSRYAYSVPFTLLSNGNLFFHWFIRPSVEGTCRWWGAEMFFTIKLVAAKKPKSKKKTYSYASTHTHSHRQDNVVSLLIVVWGWF